MTSPSEDEQDLLDSANKYYVGLWNLLIKEGASKGLIVNCAINNMLSVMDMYLDRDMKIDLLESVVKTIKEEASLEVEGQH